MVNLCTKMAPSNLEVPKKSKIDSGPVRIVQEGRDIFLMAMNSRSEDEFGVVGGVDIGGGRVCASRTAHGIEEEKRKTLEENSRKHLRRVFP